VKSLPDIESFPVRANMVNTQNVHSRLREENTESS
jgi:hypothetical protein